MDYIVRANILGNRNDWHNWIRESPRLNGAWFVAIPTIFLEGFQEHDPLAIQKFFHRL